MANLMINIEAEIRKIVDATVPEKCFIGIISSENSDDDREWHSSPVVISETLNDAIEEATYVFATAHNLSLDAVRSEVDWAVNPLYNMDDCLNDQPMTIGIFNPDDSEVIIILSDEKPGQQIRITQSSREEILKRLCLLSAINQMAST